MKSLIISALLLISAAASVSAATSTTVVAPHHAKPAPKPPVASKLTPNEAAALDGLKKLSAALKATVGVDYSAKISVVSGQYSTDPDKPKVFDTKVSIERSGRAAITLSPVGTGKLQIFADGKNVTVFDSGLAKYSQAPAAANFLASMQALFRAATSVYTAQQGDSVLDYEIALVFPFNYTLDDFHTQPKAEGTKLTLTSENTILNGESVQEVVQKYATPSGNDSITYWIDQTTNLPVEFAEEAATPAGKVALSITETFSSFQVMNAPEEASTYSFTPPAGAALVAASATPDQAPSRLLAAGTTAPDFTVASATGKLVKLSDFAGKVVVIDFWATWCGPCQASLPHTDAVAKVYQQKGVVFLPICSWDQKASFTKWQKAHAAWSMSFYNDPAGEDEASSIAAKLYGVDGIPSQYVIGKDGKVKDSFVGYDESGDPTEKTLVAAINKAL